MAQPERGLRGLIGDEVRGRRDVNRGQGIPDFLFPLGAGVFEGPGTENFDPFVVVLEFPGNDARALHRLKGDQGIVLRRVLERGLDRRVLFEFLEGFGSGVCGVGGWGDEGSNECDENHGKALEQEAHQRGARGSFRFRFALGRDQDIGTLQAG